MSRNWMPTYWGDYLRDTRHFNTTQHGAYLLLIAHYWQNGSLPTDEAQLATIAGLTVARWRTLSPPIAAKFSSDWTHGRIEKEIAKTDKRITQRKIFAQRGGFASGISKAIAKAKAEANDVAKSEQKRTNHKERYLTSSEQEAARAPPQNPTITATSAAESPIPAPPVETQQGRRGGNGAKAVHELTRAEIEASFPRNRQPA